MKECHKDLTSGHLGTKRALHHMIERFMWPGVAKEVNKLVRNLCKCGDRLCAQSLVGEVAIILLCP
jgi:hypothetical protein